MLLMAAPRKKNKFDRRFYRRRVFNPIPVVVDANMLIGATTVSIACNDKDYFCLTPLSVKREVRQLTGVDMKNIPVHGFELKKLEENKKLSVFLERARDIVRQVCSSEYNVMSGADVDVVVYALLLKERYGTAYVASEDDAVNTCAVKLGLNVVKRPLYSKPMPEEYESGELHLLSKSKVPLF